MIRPGGDRFDGYNDKLYQRKNNEKIKKFSKMEEAPRNELRAKGNNEDQRDQRIAALPGVVWGRDAGSRCAFRLRQ